MTEQWISAKKALEIVRDEGALIGRLRSGLLQARGNVRHSHESVTSFRPIRPEFWVHDPYFDFQSNWQSGDFTNCVDGHDNVDAYDVSIALSGLLEMMPFQDRGLLARRLSVASSDEWLTAQAARALLLKTRVNPASAGMWIIEQGRLGFVIARAVQVQCQIGAISENWTWEEREWDVPTWFWTDFTDHRRSNQDWMLGRFSGKGSAPQGFGAITLSGLHFHKRTMETLLGLVSESGGQQHESAEPESKRGRKATYDWQSANTAIWGRLLRGDLIPQSQADVEQAFILFLTRGDQEPSESTVRPYAKTIFDEFRKP